MVRPDGSTRWFARHGRFGRSFTCRVIELEEGVIVEADYHHIEGELQRHFPSVESVLADN